MYWKTLNTSSTQGRIQKFWKWGAQNPRVPNYCIPALTAFWISCSCLLLKVCPPFRSTSQSCIGLYRDTHRMKQHLLVWLKTKCLKWYTMYNTLLINNRLSSMQLTWANFSIENIKWHIFLDFICCCNANLYSRLGDKLSKGSSPSTFKNGCDRDAGQSYGNTKNCTIDNNKNKNTIKSHLKKEVLRQFNWNVYGIYLPPIIDILSEQKACHNMSIIHTAWSLFCQILILSDIDWLVHNSTDQSESKTTDATGALIFCCMLLVKTYCQNNAIES